jgi:hypothetical protein
MKNTFTLLALCASLIGGAQTPQTLTLNLAVDPPGAITQTLMPGKYEVQILNRLPYGAYNIAIVLEDELLPAFSTDGLKPSETKALTVDECTPLATKEKEIYALEDEKMLPAKRAEIEKFSGCAEYPAVKERLKGLDFVSQETFQLKKSQTLTITVSRVAKDGKKLEWKRVYKTPSRGQWLTCYSFNFISLSMSKERSFFAAAVPDTSLFQISRESDRKPLNFVPSITFTWLSARAQEQTWGLGGSAGVGFDLQKPVVFVGLSLIYNQNLHLSAGFAAHQTRQLTGKYVEGQIIKENLTDDQLHINPYRVNPYIAVSLRFDKNPFKL